MVTSPRRWEVRGCRGGEVRGGGVRERRCRDRVYFILRQRLVNIFWYFVDVVTKCNPLRLGALKRTAREWEGVMG